MRESDRRHVIRALGALALSGLLAFSLALISPPERSKAAAPGDSRETISGRAHVIDGDTIAIGDTRIRLEGIDAPEASQQCNSRETRKWACGASATRTLAAMIGKREVHCDSSGLDKYGRVLGVCHVGRLEINAEMVRLGLAWAFIRYSTRLVHLEAEARRLRRGLWQAENQPAWTYRANRWASAESAAPQGCAIKGNISNSGRVYHVPWSRHYEIVRIDTARGERWFCSEGEALAAGWRPAKLN